MILKRITHQIILFAENIFFAVKLPHDFEEFFIFGLITPLRMTTKQSLPQNPILWGFAVVMTR